MSILFLRMRMNQKKNVTRMQQMSLLTLKYQDERDRTFVNNMIFQRKELNQTIKTVICKTQSDWCYGISYFENINRVVAGICPDFSQENTEVNYFLSILLQKY